MTELAVAPARNDAGSKLIVVMPVYEDRKSAITLLQRLSQVCPSETYVVAVEDGSVCDPLSGSDLTAADIEGEVIHLTRNLGHQRAIAAGLTYVARHHSPRTVVVMDSDGEDRPEAIAGLIDRLARGDVDAVVAQRTRRRNFRLFYLLYRWLFHLLTGRTIQFGNFCALSNIAVRRLAAMQEVWVHLAASLMISRLRVTPVPTNKGERYAGKSTMNFLSLALHGIRSMMVFAEDVLIRVGTFCLLLALGAVMLLLATAALGLMGAPTPSWLHFASGILFILFLQAGMLTLLTLMLSGIVKSTPPITRVELEHLIETVERTSPRPASVRVPIAAKG
jgi:hypothetical protein